MTGPDLKLKLLGKPEVFYKGERLDSLSDKAQALLYYLIVTGEPHKREELAYLLWGNRQSLSNLRQILFKGLGSIPDSYILKNDAEQTVAFNTTSEYWSDLNIFQANLTKPLSQVDTQDLNGIVDAVSLYRGTFLDSFYIQRCAPEFDDWISYWRSKLEDLFVKALKELSSYFLVRGQIEVAVKYVEQLLNIDSTDENVQEQMMRIQIANGERSAALTQYRKYLSALKKEYGEDTEPSNKMKALYERIKAGMLDRDAAMQWSNSNTTEQRNSERTDVDRIQDDPMLIRQQNPFVVGPAIEHPYQFFGRDRQLSRISDYLRRKPVHHVAITGPRRSGKTSLLNYLRSIDTTPPEQLRPGQRRGLLSESRSYRWILVDFQDRRMGSLKELLRYLANSMELPVSPPNDLISFVDATARYLRTRTVILFDEIEVALNLYPELDFGFWASLRSFTNHQYVRNYLSFVIASAKFPKSLATEHNHGSSFLNIVGYTLELGAFTQSEASELISASPQPFSDEDINWIIAQSECWPLYVQILCDECLNSKRNHETDTAWRGRGLQRIKEWSSQINAR